MNCLTQQTFESKIIDHASKVFAFPLPDQYIRSISAFIEQVKFRGFPPSQCRTARRENSLRPAAAGTWISNGNERLEKDGT